MVAGTKYTHAVQIMQAKMTDGHVSIQDEKYKMDIASILYALRNKGVVVLDVIRAGLQNENISFEKWVQVKMKKLYIGNMLKGGHGRGSFFCQVPTPWDCGKVANKEQFEELLSIVNLIIAEWAVLTQHQRDYFFLPCPKT